MSSSASAWLRVAAAGLAGAFCGIAAVVGVARTAHPGTPRVPEAALSAARLASARSAALHAAPRSQRAALVDHHVTPTEYRAAVERTMRCLAGALAGPEHQQRRRPTEFHGPTWSADRYSLTYAYAVAATHVDVRRLDRACQERYSRRIEALFHLQRRADPAYLRRSTSHFHACLDAAHLPGSPADPPRARFRAVITSPAVSAHQAVLARRCIGAFPSIGDLDP